MFTPENTSPWNLKASSNAALNDSRFATAESSIRETNGNLVLFPSEIVDNSDETLKTIPISVLAASELQFENDSTAFPSNAVTSNAVNSWKVTLHDLELCAARQNQVIRSDSTFLQAGNPLLQGVDAIQSTFDPSIQKSGYLYGQRGIDAALSDFDVRMRTQLLTGKNDQVQNSRFLSGGILPGGTLRERNSIFSTSLRKYTVRGASVGLVHDWNYDASNRQDLFYSSVYTGNVRAELRQPLLAGFGKQFNLTAGPLGDNIDGVTGVSQGVLVSRLAGEEARVDLEIAILRLVRDIHVLYWQLSSATIAELQFIEYRRRIDSLTNRIAASIESANIGSKADLLDVEDAVLSLQRLVARNRRTINDTDLRLRRLVGLESNSSLTILPAEQPIDVEIDIDKESSIDSALRLRSERTKTALKTQSISNQLLAAKNLLLPRFDAISTYRVNGFGNNLGGPIIPGPDQEIQNAYANLFQGDNEGWQAGLEYSQVLGRRLGHTRVRNIQLQMMRLKLFEAEQAKEIESEVIAAIGEVDHAKDLLRIARARCETNRNRTKLLESAFEAGVRNDQLPRIAESLTREAESFSEYCEALGQYYAALANLEYRRGTLSNDCCVRVELNPADG